MSYIELKRWFMLAMPYPDWMSSLFSIECDRMLDPMNNCNYLKALIAQLCQPLVNPSFRSLIVPEVTPRTRRLGVHRH